MYGLLLFLPLVMVAGLFLNSEVSAQSERAETTFEYDLYLNGVPSNLMFSCTSSPRELASSLCGPKPLTEAQKIKCRLQIEKFVNEKQKSDCSKIVSEAVQVDGFLRPLAFTCGSDPSKVAETFCKTWNITNNGLCRNAIGEKVKMRVAVDCDQMLEDWTDKPISTYLESLQWRILEKSTYLGVETWKFPMDIWVYREIIYDTMPSLLIEIGNNKGGSTLWFAHLFDLLGKGRIIAVDIDQKLIDPRARNHPRITWIEADAVDAFTMVKPLVKPEDTVMVVEDASHKYGPTLQIMERYGTLVTPGSFMIIEDTVLHNGVKNKMFEYDDGAFASVRDFMKDPLNQEIWRIAREKEEFILTWNPKGFLQKRTADGKKALNPTTPKRDDKLFYSKEIDLLQSQVDALKQQVREMGGVPRWSP